MKLYAAKILLSDGWAEDKTLIISNGVITEIANGYVEGADRIQGVIIPGMVNCHSHAFQRAFAGFSEQGSESQDSFWTWRKIMYQFLGKLTELDAQVIATQLYIEMVKMGYTRVAEFHYLHHDIDGENYPELSTMAKAIFGASAAAGIGLTLLPVLYQYSGFGELKPTDGQKRFINSTEQFNQLVTDCFNISQQYENANIGIAPHSLRAVDKNSLTSAVEHVRSLNNKAPIHIHIAEQQKEVDDCLAHYQKRPVQWLLDNIKLDEHWCLIHATHINEQERKGMVDTGAIAGICPTTEANLGDGIFPTAEFLADGGTMAIGSDSHISVNPIEELRWLEYAQRLIKQQRAILANNNEYSVGKNLWQKATTGGAQSTSSNTGTLAVGKQADLLVIDDSELALFANADANKMDSLVFASQQNMIKDVMVYGKWQVKNYCHPMENESKQAFSLLLKRLSDN